MIQPNPYSSNALRFYMTYSKLSFGLGQGRSGGITAQRERPFVKETTQSPLFLKLISSAWLMADRFFEV
jgi:hypothetical protein